MTFRPGQLTAPEAARLNDLMRTLEAFRKMYAAPPLSLTHEGGNPTLRISETGFPGKTTSLFDNATGYSWERLRIGRGSDTGVILDAPVEDVVTEDPSPRSGDRALTLDNNKSLPIGTRGWFELNRASGAYIFTPDPSATLYGNTCAGTSWPLSLLSTDCLRLSVFSGMPDPDPLPVKDCVACPGGAAESYTITLEGGTGDYSLFRGAWIFTRTTGCTWTGELEGASAELTIDDGVARIVFGADVLVLTAMLICAGPMPTDLDTSSGTGTLPTWGDLTAIAPDPSPEITLTSTDGEAWASDSPLTICDTAYTVSFSRLTKVLTLTGPATSGGSTTFDSDLDCGGCAYLNLAFLRSQLCPCEPRVAPPCDRLLRLRLEYAACHTQAFDVDSPCCPDVLLPRIICLKAASGGIANSGATRLILEWNGDTSSWQATGGPALFGTGYCTVDLRCSYDGSVYSWLLTQSYECSGVVDSLGDDDPLSRLGKRLVADVPCPESGADFGFAIDLNEEFGDSPDFWTVSTWTETGCADDPPFISGYTTPGWYVLTNGEVRELDDADGCDPLIRILCGPYDTEEEAEAAALLPECGGVGEEPGACEEPGIERPGWAGVGYYCAKEPASLDPCVAVFLDAADRCNLAVEICSGPYASYAEAVATCAGGGDPGGGGAAYRAFGTVDLVPTTVNQWAGSTGDGTYTLVKLVEFGGWNINYVGTGGPCQWHTDTWSGVGCQTFLLVSGTCTDGSLQICSL